MVRIFALLIHVILFAPLGSAIAAGHEDNAMTITRHYVYAGDRRIHYRRAGSGPPLVIVHPSPGSSFGVIDRIQRHSANHTVIALDTPGYGESEALTLERPTLTDYAQALVEALDALGLPQTDLYGAHTGAGIALETAHRFPDRVRRVVLDGLPVFTDAERQDYLDNYTPSLAPRWDGSHLITTWAMRRDMYVFAPWYERTRDARRKRDLPSADALHDVTVDFLRAGHGYWKGYHAIFRSDPTPALTEIRRPTLLLSRPTDALVGHLTRLDNVSASVTLEVKAEDADGLAARFLARGRALPDAGPAPAVTPSADQVRRSYVEVDAGQILMRRVGPTSGRPLVLFHASPASSLGMESLMLAFAGERPVFTFDNPGNGDSAPLEGSPDLTDTATALVQAVRAAGIDDYDLYGTHTGAMIAMEAAIADPDSVRHLILDGITIFSDEFTQELLTEYVEPLETHIDGRHMIWAWNFLRDVGLWWPHYNRTIAGAEGRGGVGSPEGMHRGVVEFLKGGRTFHHNYQAAFAYPTAERLPLVKTPMLICASKTDPLRNALEPAKKIVPNAMVELTNGRGDPATLELYRRFMGSVSE